MLIDMNEVFSFQQVSLENIHLLPECSKRIIYFVTATQGENHTFLYISCVNNLKANFENHKRGVEFEFLNKIGYQINISWIVLPDGTTQKEAQLLLSFWSRAFQPKLNDCHNTFARLQAEQLRYEHLKKQIESWEQSGDDKDTVIKKIWEVCK